MGDLRFSISDFRLNDKVPLTANRTSEMGPLSQPIRDRPLEAN